MVLTDTLFIVVVAYMSVPETIHLKGSPPPLPPVEVLYLLPWASKRTLIVAEVDLKSLLIRTPDTLRYPDSVMFVPDALVNLKVEIVEETERIEDDTSPIT